MHASCPSMLLSVCLSVVQMPSDLKRATTYGAHLEMFTIAHRTFSTPIALVNVTVLFAPTVGTAVSDERHTQSDRACLLPAHLSNTVACHRSQLPHCLVSFSLEFVLPQPARTTMAGMNGRVVGWLQRFRRSTVVLSLSHSSTSLTKRCIYSSSLSSSLSANTSLSPVVPVYQQLHQFQPAPHRLSSPDSTQHRCSASCSHHAIPSISTLPPSTRTVLSAIDSLSAPSTSAPPSLLSALSVPVCVPSPSPVADVPLECAVPKRKPSPRAQRHRRAGQRATHARRLHQTYRICLNCGSPVKPHYMCIRCRQVIGRF